MRQIEASTMRVLRPAPHVIAFYDGRAGGARAWSEGPNWLDDGALALGTCSYAVVDGADALVYDTHMSVSHAAAIRRTLDQEGVRTIRVVLSHWHVDHVAGNAVFRDCEIVANRLTADLMLANQAALEGGEPPIAPLIHPTTLFEGQLALQVGTLPVELRQVDAHSQDGTVLLLPEARLLLAGDTLEDPLTFVTEPARLEHHLAGLDQMASWDIDRILPNHADPDVIAAGGFRPSLIAATRRYVEALLHIAEGRERSDRDLRDVLAEDLAAGTVRFFHAYEDVHRHNVAKVLARSAGRSVVNERTPSPPL